MNTTFKKNRTQKIDGLLRKHLARLKKIDWSKKNLRMLVYPLSQNTTDFEKSVALKSPYIYPEEYAFHLALKKMIENEFSTQNSSKADYFYLPFFFAAMELNEVDLEESIEKLQFIHERQKHLILFTTDKYTRPLKKRSNFFCRFASLNKKGEVVERELIQSYRWLDERFILAGYESSIDFQPQDIALLPPIPKKPTPPHSCKRPFKIGYCGTIYYNKIPKNHIRGKNNLVHWNRLVNSKRKDIFVGDLKKLQKKMGMKSDFFTLPEKSIFTLCPAGYARWSFRAVEAIISGSIPVFLSDYYLKPFENKIPWNTFSLTLPEASLPKIEQILDNLTEQKITSLQHHLKLNQHHFTTEGMVELLVDELIARKST